MIVEEFVDKVVTVDYNARGVVKTLYRAARELCGQPLCEKAAQIFRVSSSLAIATGFRILRFGGAVESDGLVSSVLLSKWLELRGGRAVIFVDEGSENVVAAGLRQVRATQSFVIGVPTNFDACREKVEEAFEEIKPDVYVSVERPGANILGQYHNSVGDNITGVTAPIDKIFQEKRGSGSLFVAFGDGGNEAGMGKIRSTVEAAVPYGKTCKCGCGQGIASNVNADILVVANVSDFGVYGAMSLADQETYSCVVEYLPNVVESIFAAGCVDALKGPNQRGVDGLNLQTVKAVATLLKHQNK